MLRRRGSVALLFALSLLPIVLLVAAAIDMSRLADGRAALQRAVDNAALSGAAAYSVNATAYNTLAMTIATTSFCDQSASINGGFTVVTSGTVGGTTAKTCSANGAGPSISAVIGGYKPGTPGAAANSNCTATNPVVSGGQECGFIVTVTATATLAATVPSLFGGSPTVSVTGVAFNPFLILANTLHSTLQGSAFNDNSLWVYPLLLDGNGQPDFSSNPGALPQFNAAYSQDASPSGCNDDPLTTSCGAYSMIADTAFATTYPNYYCTTNSPCSVGSTKFINGVVQNPAAPNAVLTATTPLGIAMESIAGGSASYGYDKPVAGGSGCYYPGLATYGTVAQVFANNPGTGGNYVFNYPSNFNPFSNNNALPWPTVTHWFFSSYLANTGAPLPPDEGEILSQSGGSNLDVQSFGKSVATPANTFSPTVKTCAPNAPSASPNDELLTTFYPSSGQTNRNLFITTSTSSTYLAPDKTNPNGTGYGNPDPNSANSNYLDPADDTAYYWAPASTPGQKYAALSCQAYGSNYYTFYWNDMGGTPSYGDTYDYGNGSVQIGCNGPSFIVLIQ